MGTMVKYWNTMPSANAKMKSSTHAEKILCSQSVCSPSQVSTTGKK
jgi:hypothetical protein